MKFIEPVKVTDAVLTTPPVPETDYPAWSAPTNYAIGDRVVRSTVHRIFEALVAGAHAGLPEATPSRWLEVRPTNAWASFDEKVGTLTVAPAPAAFVLTPGMPVDHLALLDVSASAARAVMTVSGVPVYDRMISMEAADTVGDAWEYCFSPILRRSIAMFDDLPPYSTGVITVTLQDTEPVSWGTCIVGQSFEIGESEFGARAGITDFSRKERDQFGAIAVVERAYSKRTQQIVAIDAGRFDEVFRRLSLARAKPLLFIGAAGLYEAFVVYGFFKSLEQELQTATEAVCSLEIEGLV